MDLVPKSEKEGSGADVFPRAFLSILFSEGIQKLLLCEGGLRLSLILGETKVEMWLQTYSLHLAAMGMLCSNLSRSPSTPLVQCEDCCLVHEGIGFAPLLL